MTIGVVIKRRTDEFSKEKNIKLKKQYQFGLDTLQAFT